MTSLNPAMPRTRAGAGIGIGADGKRTHSVEALDRSVAVRARARLSSDATASELGAERREVWFLRAALAKLVPGWRPDDFGEHAFVERDGRGARGRSGAETMRSRARGRDFDFGVGLSVRLLFDDLGGPGAEPPAVVFLWGGVGGGGSLGGSGFAEWLVALDVQAGCGDRSRHDR
jgi:hypothetical protein